MLESIEYRERQKRDCFLSETSRQEHVTFDINYILGEERGKYEGVFLKKNIFLL